MTLNWFLTLEIQQHPNNGVGDPSRSLCFFFRPQNFCGRRWLQAWRAKVNVLRLSEFIRSTDQTEEKCFYLFLCLLCSKDGKILQKRPTATDTVVTVKYKHNWTESTQVSSIQCQLLGVNLCHLMPTVNKKKIQIVISNQVDYIWPKLFHFPNSWLRLKMTWIIKWILLKTVKG